MKFVGLDCFPSSKHQMVEVTDALEEVTDLLFIGQIDRVALRSLGQVCDSMSNPLPESLDATTTTAPSRAAAAAVAKPIPAVPPRRTICLPFKFMRSSLWIGIKLLFNLQSDSLICLGIRTMQFTRTPASKTGASSLLQIFLEPS